MKTMKTALLITISIAVLTSAHAGTIGVDAAAGTPFVSSGFGGFTLGWEFEVMAREGILLDGLGYWDHRSDGFFLNQTFHVGLWHPAGNLLRDTIITSNSALQPSLHDGGDWRINSVAPLRLTPGLYRIGVLMPEAGANAFPGADLTLISPPEVNFVRFLRQVGSPTLAMPDIPPANSSITYFPATFTFTPIPEPSTLWIFLAGLSIPLVFKRLLGA